MCRHTFPLLHLGLHLSDPRWPVFLVVFCYLAHCAFDLLLRVTKCVSAYFLPLLAGMRGFFDDQRRILITKWTPSPTKLGHGLVGVEEAVVHKSNAIVKTK